jgi:hypothetical protein
MTTYKVQGTLTTGGNYRFFVECESDRMAQSIIINWLMQAKQTAETLFVAEATEAEISLADRILVFREKVGA